MHTELVSFSATAPGSAGAAAAALTGDSLTIKNSKGPAHILQLWSQFQADGYLQLITPTSHDTTRGFRQVVETANIDNLLPAGLGLEVQPQELMQITIAGSATAGDVELGFALIHYDNLPGVEARGIRFGDLLRRAESLLTVQCTITGAATGYTGAELITAESDLLRANRDYAVLGISTNVACGALTLIGPDTGYVRVGVPGQSSDADMGRDYFCSLARQYDLPVSPVNNSGNKASTYLGIVQNENNVSPVIAVVMALLK
jgi:hypothetical protein